MNKGDILGRFAMPINRYYMQEINSILFFFSPRDEKAYNINQTQAFLII
jgi:hypothetical protein